MEPLVILNQTTNSHAAVLQELMARIAKIVNFYSKLLTLTYYYKNKLFKNIVNLCPLKCLNGGTCYVNNSNSPACQCQRGYLGLSCEQDICLQALLTGTCTDRYQRYYYNALFKSCQPFLYTGCGGTILINLKKEFS